MKAIKILAIAVMSILVSACGATGPQNVLEGYYRAVDRGDTAMATSLLDQRVLALLGEAKIKSAVEGQARKFKLHQGLKRVSIAAVPGTQNRDGVIFKAFLEFNDGNQISDKVKMLQVNGAWKIGLL